MPYLAAFASFRENVRQVARSQKGTEMHCLCYYLRWSYRCGEEVLTCMHMLELTYYNKICPEALHI